MSQKGYPLTTNRTPWMDEIRLEKDEREQGANGYLIDNPNPKKREIFCTFSEGVARGEFYESMKAGMRATASIECWADDYEGETKVFHNDIEYSVSRSYPTGRGTIMLILSEVVR